MTETSASNYPATKVAIDETTTNGSSYARPMQCKACRRLTLVAKAVRGFGLVCDGCWKAFR